jgi:hypothetical protein
VANCHYLQTNFGVTNKSAKMLNSATRFPPSLRFIP